MSRNTRILETRPQTLLGKHIAVADPTGLHLNQNMPHCGTGKSFVTTGVQYIINPYDEIALTRALELTEKDGGTVTVINIGDATTEPTIRKALAIGATDAVRVNAAPRDAYFVAKQIADYAKDKGFDMILTGRESIDYNGAQVASMVAEMLDLPAISSVKMLSLNGSVATIEREIEGGKPRNLPV